MKEELLDVNTSPTFLPWITLALCEVPSWEGKKKKKSNE